MFRIILFFAATALAMPVFSQTIISSVDNYTGFWKDNASWIGNVAPSSTVSDPPGSVMNIYGYLSHEGDLSLSGRGTINIYDTLWVSGDLVLKNKVVVNVARGGLLIVTGNKTITSTAELYNDGTVVVQGALTASGSSNIYNELSVFNTYYAFNGVTQNGGARFNGSKFVVDGFFRSELFMILNNIVLFNFLNAGPLPVEFVSFNALVENDAVTLNWATATEQNNDYFELEYSTDGVNYNAISRVAGAGNSDELISYQYTHEVNYSGNMFYRIKQVDYDGAFEYSNVRKVKLHTGSFGVNVYPNPTTGILNVALRGGANETVSVEVITATGEVSVEPLIQDSFQSQLILDLRAYQAGVYRVKVQSGDKSKVIAVLVQ